MITSHHHHVSVYVSDNLIGDYTPTPLRHLCRSSCYYCGHPAHDHHPGGTITYTFKNGTITYNYPYPPPPHQAHIHIDIHLNK